MKCREIIKIIERKPTTEMTARRKLFRYAIKTKNKNVRNGKIFLFSSSIEFKIY